MVKVFTYNVCWEANKPAPLSYNGKLSGDLLNVCQNNVEKCRQNISNTISNYLHKNKYDFIALQEIPIENSPGLQLNDWIKRFKIKNNHNVIINTSGFEKMMTIYDSTKYRLIQHKFGNLNEKGRPFNSILFEDIKSKQNLMFVNLHAGHSMKSYGSLQMKKQIEKQWSKQTHIDRVIVAGDFNRDIPNIDENYKLSLNLFGFNLYNKYKNRLLSCCSTSSSPLYKYPKDHILDSYTGATYKKGKINFPSSDHLYISALLKPFKKKKLIIFIM